MYHRSLAVLGAALALASVACGSEPECGGVFYAPIVSGSFEASNVPLAAESDLFICLNQVCDSSITSRVKIERSAMENTELGAATPTKPVTVKVSFNTKDSTLPAPQTGDILRLRYPNKPEGPWSFDVSLNAKVNPRTSCEPAYGTFTQ